MNGLSSGGVTKKRAKVSRACDNCRKRKIKCTGDLPCFNCQNYSCECTYSRGAPLALVSDGPRRHVKSTTKTSSIADSASDFASMSSKSSVSSYSNSTACSHNDASNGLYGDDSHTIEQINLLKSTLRCLKEAQPSQRVLNAVQSITEQLRETEAAWKPCLDIRAIRDVPPTATSLETQLMINKYSDKVSLTKYATIQPSPFLSRSNVLNQYPVLDDMFGLYSPGLLMSIRGIGFLFKHFFDSGVKMSREYKTTLFLMLRFFDACAHFVDVMMQSCTSPLNTYATLMQVNYDTREIAIQELLATIPKETKVSTLKLFPHLGCPPSSSDSLGMFHWITRMMFVSCVDSVCKPPNCDNYLSLKSDIEQFMHTQEVLSVLGFEFFNNTTYTPAGNLDYLDTLVFFIKHQYCLSEYHVIPHLVSRLVSYSQNMGIHRWEYYVGMDELTAERRRRVWWSCFCWDIMGSILSGKQAMISTSSVSCLLPEYFRNVGILEPDELLRKIASLEELPSGSITDKIEFCGTSLAIVIADFFQNVLYSKKNTCFENTAKPSSLRDKIISDLIRDVQTFTERITGVEKLAKQLQDFSELHANDCPMDLNAGERKTPPRLAIFIDFARAICLGSVEHLYARFKVNDFPRPIQESLNAYRLSIHTSWRSVITAIGNGNIDHVWLALSCGSILSLSVLTDLFTQKTRDTMQDIRLILNASTFLDKLSFLEHCSGKIGETSRLLRTFTKWKTLFQILVRIGLQLYMRTSQLTIAAFLDLLAVEDAELVCTATRILMLSQDTFTACHNTKDKTSWHVNVERSVEQAQALVNPDRFPDANADLTHPLIETWSHPCTSPSGNIPAEKSKTKEATLPLSPPINFNLGSLDDFLNFGEDDLYNKLWSDINIDILDLVSSNSGP
ncbi:LAME_0F01596g1_1 [Lachancea meyersii CBS 8951]|uniref:LAME_0F01596g1_1 n=1 Tax=Lachancea meyersii CBS 8951 TaxID=1266667 RepID=A0A1G4JPV9_9SACH|nr:LAME_0F01596g1_1 [Lachancea meyersii CBS 8951]